MANVRLTIVMRRDLKMPIGLFGAQCAHTTDQFQRENASNSSSRSWRQEELDWFKSPYLSVLAVECLDDLELVIADAERAELEIHVWEDTIQSPTFKERAIQTKVGVSIGPHDFDAIKMVTSSLPLYN
jgi:peptidyl-tRNA hydrolase